MCGPEFSDLETSIWERFRNEGVELFGISNESRSTIEQFVSDQGVSFPVLRDNKGIYGRYAIGGGISPYPRDYIIDQDGVLRYASTEYEPQRMISVIQSLKETTQIDTAQSTSLPREPTLYQNYPNPFNAQTQIRYFIPSESPVTLRLFDLTGSTVATIDAGRREPGLHRISFNGNHQSGEPLSSGVYIYRLVVDGRIAESRKLLLMR